MSLYSDPDADEEEEPCEFCYRAPCLCDRIDQMLVRERENLGVSRMIEALVDTPRGDRQAVLRLALRVIETSEIDSGA